MIPLVERKMYVAGGSHLRPQNPTRLTTIIIGPHENSRRIYVFWSLITTGEHFDLLYVPDTKTLFDSVVAPIPRRSTLSLNVDFVQQNDIMLFQLGVWNGERNLRSRTRRG